MDKFVKKLGPKASGSRPQLSTQPIEKVLQDNFGFAEFRSPFQENAIRSLLPRDRDVYVCLPTGGGKSLCYQLPTLAHSAGLTIVVSPLIALINDQILHLKKKNIRAETINSTLSKSALSKIVDDLAYGVRIDDPIRFVYVCPETLKTEKFMRAISGQVRMKRILYIAVDEAHCVSQMGHDFRKDYLLIGNFVKNLRQQMGAGTNLPVIALTATATKEVRLDIERHCHLSDNYLNIVGSTFRDNLFYDVKILNPTTGNGRGHARKDLVKFIKKNLATAGVGIIYCRTREDCSYLESDLASDFERSPEKITVRAFHAGFTSKVREEIQNQWQEEKVKVMIATLAFGMGIDKANVRFVVHWSLPKSLTSYYQESGRAGRDGRGSFCRLYFSMEDCRSIRFLINKEYNDLAKGQGRIYYNNVIILHAGGANAAVAAAGPEVGVVGLSLAALAPAVLPIGKATGLLAAALHGGLVLGQPLFGPFPHASDLRVEAPAIMFEAGVNIVPRHDLLEHLDHEPALSFAGGPAAGRLVFEVAFLTEIFLGDLSQEHPLA